MKIGIWGGRFPLLNYLASNILFYTLLWRAKTKKTINILRQSRVKHVMPTKSKEELNLEIRAYIDNGLNRLNIGGGIKNFPGYVNIDFVRHLNVEREIVANILDLAFIPDRSISHVHSNHVLEHLTESQICSQLAQYRRILTTGGLLTFRCPNALGVCFGFLLEPIIETGREEFTRLGFPSEEDLCNPKDVWMGKDIYGFFHWLYGDVGNPENEHLTLVTPTKVINWLNHFGFDIQKMSEPEAVNIVVVARKRKSEGV